LSDLGIWHFDDNPADATYLQWVFLTGPINVYSGYDTITITTNSFSPFELGERPLATPEPATITLLASGFFAIGGFGLVRRRRAAVR
jgi:hypothetical protein